MISVQKCTGPVKGPKRSVSVQPTLAARVSRVSLRLHNATATIGGAQPLPIHFGTALPDPAIKTIAMHQSERPGPSMPKRLGAEVGILILSLVQKLTVT